MSMPKIEKSENPINREQSISNLIESVALMETGLSHIVNAEGEKIQKVIKYDSDEDVPLDDLLKVNESAEKMINSISKLEMILQNKLDTSKELDESGITPSEYPCESLGELLDGGDMESFTDNIPDGWHSTAPVFISKVTDLGRVHSGESAVNISDRGDIVQTFEIKGGCFYELSFFAQSVLNNAEIFAEIMFYTSTGPRLGGRLSVRSGDLPTGPKGYGYYKLLTDKSPQDASGVTISIIGGNYNQSFDLDDVSFVIA